MSIRNKTALLLPFILVLIYGCYNDNSEDLYPNTGSNCDTAITTYTAVIKPIIDANCAVSGCHIGTAATGYDFTTYSGFASVANNGKLVAAIEHTGPNPMPRGKPKLDDCTINKIKRWVS